MTVRYVLAPEAALDLVKIWRYIKEQTSVEMADRVESVIREKMAFLAQMPGRRTSAQEPDRPRREVLLGLLVLDPISRRRQTSAGSFHSPWPS